MGLRCRPLLHFLLMTIAAWGDSVAGGRRSLLRDPPLDIRLAWVNRSLSDPPFADRCRTSAAQGFACLGLVGIFTHP